MKKILAAMLFTALLLVGCGKADDTVATTVTTQSVSSIVTTVQPVEFGITTESEPSTAVTTEPEASTITTTEAITKPAVTTDEPKPQQPAEFDLDDVSSVEDYYGGDVEYKADFDGDGEKENCTVKIVGHGTQCYVEEIEITRANGEKIVVEHPVTATGMRSNLYKSKDGYEIYLHMSNENYTQILYPFDKLATAEENLIAPRFGDIFDYSVIGDKLYFRGSVACGMSEVLGDIVYEYVYQDGALKVNYIRYIDNINGKDYDIGGGEPTDSLLVEPCKEDRTDVTLPDTEPLVEARAIMGNPTFLVYEKGLTYYVKQYSSPLDDEYTLKKYTLSLPEGYTDGVIIDDGPGGGSGELGFAVHTKNGERDVVLYYLFYADRLAAPVYVWEDEDTVFTPDAGSKLYEVYAHPSWHFCWIRTYANADDEIMYYIIDLADEQRIRYDKLEDAHPAATKDIAAFADVNFDGIDDFCLKLGNFGAQGTLIVRAYLGEAEWERYTLCEGLEKISNPAIDAENKCILSTSRESASEYWYGKYEFKDGEFVKTAELVYNMADETVTIGGEVLPSEEFIKSGSEWDILNAKWFNIIK